MKLPEHFSDFFDMSNPLAQRYCDFVFADHDESNSREEHHIIPRAWYRRQGIPVDNSDENIVPLPGKDHFKAHYLMFKYLESTDDLDMTYRMLFPVINMISPFWRKDVKSMSEQELEQCGRLYQEAREKFCLMQRDAIWATDGTTNRRFQQNEQIPDGWIPNKRVRHDKVKRIYITDGNRDRFLPVTEQIPDGFRAGRCSITFNPETDIWITDGKATVKWAASDPLPDGWWPGSHCCLGKVKITNGAENRMISEGEQVPDGWRFGVTMKPGTNFAHTTGKAHICKDGIRKMVAREDLDKWLAMGWTNSRACKDPSAASKHISEAKSGILEFTNGKQKKRVPKSETVSMYEAGWWFTNRCRRYPKRIFREYGIDYADLRRRFGYEYDNRWARLVL